MKGNNNMKGTCKRGYAYITKRQGHKKMRAEGKKAMKNS